MPASQRSRIAKLREEKDTREFAELTLRPTINPESHAVEGRSVEQQYLYWKLYEKRRLDKAKTKEALELADCTFKPHTNKVRVRYASADVPF